MITFGDWEQLWFVVLQADVPVLHVGVHYQATCSALGKLISAKFVTTDEQARALAPPGVEVIKDSDGVLSWKRRRHPLYGSVALTLLAEIINAR